MYKITTNDVEGQVSEITQSLDELARQGAHRMILAALELEVGNMCSACALPAAGMLWYNSSTVQKTSG